MKRFIVIVVLAVAAMAFSSPSDVIAENTDGVNDVDINTDTGEIKIETDDGSISVDQGGATIRAENWSSDDDRGINMTDCFGPDGAAALCVILLDF